MAEANPAPFPDRSRWFFDDKPISGQFGFYYEIMNVTKAFHNHQIKCSVENELGVATAVRTIQVQCEPLYRSLTCSPPLINLFVCPSFQTVPCSWSSPRPRPEMKWR